MRKHLTHFPSPKTTTVVASSPNLSQPLPYSNFFKRKNSRIPQDLLGNIAILKFPRKTFKIIKILKARKFLKQNKTITTIVEKTEKIQGKLRTHKTKHLAGIKTKTATYKENNCIFKFDIDKSYFSPRLSNERKIIAEEVSSLMPNAYSLFPTKMCNILVMFAGIAPYPIIVAKKLKQQNKSFHIYSNELNKEANKEAKKNITLNKLNKYITLIPGNANRLPSQLPAKRTSNLQRSGLPTDNIEAFDIILMPRPNLSDTFLKTALKLSKKGTTIFYHGFGTKQEVLNEIKENTNNQIGIIKIRKAGDIAPYKYRWQAQFKVK